MPKKQLTTARNGSKMEVAVDELTKEIMVKLMALDQIDRVVIASFSWQKLNSILKRFKRFAENKKIKTKLSKLERLRRSHWIRNYFYYF